jgi:hypothetical protein
VIYAGDGTRTAEEDFDGAAREAAKQLSKRLNEFR